MTVTGGSIEAILKLNATGFDTGINKAINTVNRFSEAVAKLRDVTPKTAMLQLDEAINLLNSSLSRMDSFSKQNVRTFNSLANAVNKMANGLRILQSDELDVVQGVNTMNNIFKAFQGTLNGTEVKIKGVATVVKELSTDETKTASTTEQVAVATQQYASALEVALPTVRSMITNNVELANAERLVAGATTQETSAIEKDSVAKTKNVASTNQLSNATSRLRGAMNSLKMMGTMVGSMLAYNFAHKLLVATGETVHAKSEMEGYFNMLHFGQSEVDKFNKALDQTVTRFQRVNKYSLGETISSIGVEFDLTTDEMIKAMDVTSMITSEYLRAGRNANEASLAVKDVLQGQFQRLSRETGVKGEQLKEAGWNGDVTDVNSLLDALRKVAEDRNWDVFAEKANSLNDILTITQNRFGEWSADMVNVVQPTIVNAFNSMMSFAQGLSVSLSGLWKWLNGNGWGQIATKIGLVTGAILVLMPTLTAYRSGATLLEVANMGLSKSLTSLIFGIKAESMANMTASESIAMKILGIEAEEVAESGLLNVIRAKILGVEAETLTNEMATASNYGFIGSLYALITGETLAEAETIGLTGAIALLTGAFLSSPIGWFTLAILGLASAFYVLSGGLDDSWDKMKQFHDAMQDTDSAMQPHTEYLRQLAKDVGETSDKYKTAKESVDDFYKHLQSGKAQYDKSQLAFENANIGMTDNSKKIFEKYGISDEDKEKYIANFDYLVTGKDKYYKAEQVINKQIYDENSNFATNLDSLINQMGKDNPRLEEEIGKLQGNYQNLAEHSYIANTTDDWWEWMWNSLYAGMDQFWIDWDNFWRDPQWSSGIDGLIRGLETSNPFGGILKAIGIDYDNVGKQITDFFNGIGAYFEGKTLMELLGLDPNYDYVGEWWQGVCDQFASIDVGAWFDGVLQQLNNFDWSFGLSELIDNFVNSFFDNLGSGLENPSATKTINIADIMRNIVDFSSETLSEFATEIVSMFRDAITNGIQNLPVVGDLMSFFGWGTDPQTEAQTQGNEVGSSFATGTEQGLAPIPSIVETAFGSFDLTPIMDTFNINTQSMQTTATSTGLNVANAFNTMKNNAKTSMDNLVSNNTTSFNSIKTTTATSLQNMRDSTSQVTLQMTSAWSTMKDSIIASANKIKTDAKTHFDSLSGTIKGFYQKIQNPSQWAGSPSLKNSGTPRPSIGRNVAKTITGRGFAGGRGSSAPTGSMSISALKRKLCPDGNCGNLFDGFSNTDVVDVSTFLSLIGEGHGFGGWNFAQTHYNHIKNKSDKWDTGSPVINLLGGIATSTKFKVGEFNDGTPKISFEEFKSMAQTIFSAIPYRFYYDSSWKGSWLGALQAGACNCYDGALALIAFANACGFGGSIAHGTWTDPDGTSYPHVWATINGMKMDTTAWQQRGSWSAGGNVSSVKSSKPSSNQPPVNITVNVENAYGIDDLNSQIEEGIDKGLQKHFNKSFTLGV